MTAMAHDAIVLFGGIPLKRTPLPIILPLAAVLFIVLWGGGLGIGFILLGKTGLEQWGAVIVGVGLVVAVPAVGALLTMSRR